jgi:hypothetical protein
VRVDPRRLLLAGTVLTALGIAIAGVAPVFGTADGDRIRAQQTAGGVAALIGWAVLGWGIHRFGRTPEGIGRDETVGRTPEGIGPDKTEES